MEDNRSPQKAPVLTLSSCFYFQLSGHSDKIFHCQAHLQFICSSEILLQAFIDHKENLIEAIKGNLVIHLSNTYIHSSAIKLMCRGSVALLDPRD